MSLVKAFEKTFLNLGMNDLQRNGMGAGLNGTVGGVWPKPTTEKFSGVG